MSWSSCKRRLRRLAVDFEPPGRRSRRRRGCTEPTADYGQGGIEPFEVAVGEGLIPVVPEVEWAERLEALERTNATLTDRIDADWLAPLYQARCGYCWSYSVIGAGQACDSRDGRLHLPRSAASVAAQIKRGRDQGGWPVEAAAWIAEHGVCPLDMWPDCSCSGRSCKGPRGGCRARDLSQVEATREAAAEYKLRYFEIPRGDLPAVMSCLLQLHPVAGGWIRTGQWCDGHAMALTAPVRDNRRGWGLLPENSWKDYKRRVPVWRAPTGGIVAVRTATTYSTAA